MAGVDIDSKIGTIQRKEDITGLINGLTGESDDNSKATNGIQFGDQSFMDTLEVTNRRGSEDFHDANLDDNEMKDVSGNSENDDEVLTNQEFSKALEKTFDNISKGSMAKLMTLLGQELKDGRKLKIEENSSAMTRLLNNFPESEKNSIYNGLEIIAGAFGSDNKLTLSDIAAYSMSLMILEASGANVANNIDSSNINEIGQIISGIVAGENDDAETKGIDDIKSKLSLPNTANAENMEDNIKAILNFAKTFSGDKSSDSTISYSDLNKLGEMILQNYMPSMTSTTEEDTTVTGIHNGNGDLAVVQIAVGDDENTITTTLGLSEGKISRVSVARPDEDVEQGKVIGREEKNGETVIVVDFTEVTDAGYSGRVEHQSLGNIEEPITDDSLEDIGDGFEVTATDNISGGKVVDTVVGLTQYVYRGDGLSKPYASEEDYERAAYTATLKNDGNGDYDKVDVKTDKGINIEIPCNSETRLQGNSSNYISGDYSGVHTGSDNNDYLVTFSGGEVTTQQVQQDGGNYTTSNNGETNVITRNGKTLSTLKEGIIKLDDSVGEGLFGNNNIDNDGKINNASENYKDAINDITNALPKTIDVNSLGNSIIGKKGEEGDCFAIPLDGYKGFALYKVGKDGKAELQEYLPLTDKRNFADSTPPKFGGAETRAAAEMYVFVNEINNGNIDLSKEGSIGGNIVPRYQVMVGNDGYCHIMDMNYTQSMYLGGYYSTGYPSIVREYCSEYGGAMSNRRYGDQIIDNPYGFLDSSSIISDEGNRFMYALDGAPGLKDGETTHIEAFFLSPAAQEVATDDEGNVKRTFADLDGDGQKEWIDVLQNMFVFDFDGSGAIENGTEAVGNNTKLSQIVDNRKAAFVQPYNTMSTNEIISDLSKFGIELKENGDGEYSFKNAFDMLKGIGILTGKMDLEKGDLEFDADDIKWLEDNMGFGIQAEGLTTTSFSKVLEDANITSIKIDPNAQLNAAFEGNNIVQDGGLTVTINGQEVPFYDFWLGMKHE